MPPPPPHVGPGYWPAPYYPDFYPNAWAAGAVGLAAGAAAGAALAIGTMAETLPPQCATVMVQGVTYEQCGSTWYQPQFHGNRTVYVVVSPPQ